MPPRKQTVEDRIAAKNRERSDNAKTQIYQSNLPLLWSLADLDRKRNLALLVLLRILQAIFFTKAMVHPDEYWQATQPAYAFVYGHGKLPWEWSKDFQLRNTLYPMYLAGWFQAAKTLKIDYNWLVVVLPYLAHAPFVILNDIYTWRVAKRVITKDSARLAMLMLFFNVFQTQLIIRCFTNSLEQIFTTIAFYYYLD